MKFDRMPNFGQYRKFLKSHSKFDRIKPTTTPISTELTSFLFFFILWLCFFSPSDFCFCLQFLSLFARGLCKHTCPKAARSIHIYLSLAHSPSLFLCIAMYIFLSFETRLQTDLTVIFVCVALVKNT